MLDDPGLSLAIHFDPVLQTLDHSRAMTMVVHALSSLGISRATA